MRLYFQPIKESAEKKPESTSHYRVEASQEAKFDLALSKTSEIDCHKNISKKTLEENQFKEKSSEKTDLNSVAKQVH